MLGRLTERWSYLAKLRENPSFDEDNADSQEVLDDVIIRVAAREYLDTLKVGHSTYKHWHKKAVPVSVVDPDPDWIRIQWSP
jgi:hypothetical protein